MTRAPDQLAPSWLPRQRRRHVNRALQKLFRRDTCSLCGSPFRHNSGTASGLDAQGNVALAGECCFDRLAEVFGMGFYSDRHYDFLMPRGSEAPSEAPPEKIVEAFAAYTKAIAATDKLLADVERYGGGIRASNVCVLDYEWKSNDRQWFEQNPGRTHRARMPFPDEIDKETPVGYAPVMLIRQVEPGSRLRSKFFLHTSLLPLPDDEALAHALFDVAMQDEAVGVDEFCTLIKKYQASGAAS
jgi:hypothetical protein